MVRRNRARKTRNSRKIHNSRKTRKSCRKGMRGRKVVGGRKRKTFRRKSSRRRSRRGGLPSSYRTPSTMTFNGPSRGNSGAQRDRWAEIERRVEEQNACGKKNWMGNLPKDKKESCAAYHAKKTAEAAAEAAEAKEMAENHYA